MYVSAKKWRESSIPQFLNIFTGFLGETLQNMPVENMGKFSAFLNPILWRWYFTRLSSSDDISPAAKLEYFHTIEDWPNNTLFFITPALNSDKMQATIDLDIELISFYEQPFLDDLIRKTPPHHFPSDAFYKKLTGEVQRALPDEQGIHDIKTTSELKRFWNIFFTSLLSHWWDTDPFLSSVFSLDKFVSLMESFLVDAHKAEERGITSDIILDTIIALVRKEYPEWALTTEELEAREKEWEQQKEAPRPHETMSEATMKYDTFYFLGTQFDMYFVTPLSQYLQLIEPYYMEIEHFREEIEEISVDPKGEPRFILAKPPASFQLTTFGRHLFSLILS